MIKNKQIVIKINLEEDFEIDLEYEGLELDDGEKLMLAIATKATQDLIFEKFELKAFLRELSERME